MQALRSLGILLLLCLLLPSLVTGDATSDLAAVGEEFFQWQQQIRPYFGTSNGNMAYNDRVEDLSMDVFDTYVAKVEEFLLTLSKIDRDQLSRRRQYSYDILMDMLSTFASNYDWRDYGSLNPINFLDAFYLNLDYIVNVTPFDTKQDFNNYIARMEAFPRQINQTMDRMNRAVEMGTTYHNMSVRAVPGQISAVTAVAVEHSALYKPFNDTLDSLPVTQEERNILRSRVRSALQSVWASLNTLKTYMEHTYIPNTRQTYGVYGLPSGRDYYRACLKWHLSEDMSADQVHAIGLREVDRITQLLRKVMTRQDFNGTIKEYYNSLKADSRFKLGSVQEIMDAYENIIHNRTYPKLPLLFKDIPTNPVVVKPLPYDGPFGMYTSGSDDGSRPGTFYANVLRPNDTNTFSMMALALHEAVPGHHMQAIYQAISDIPNFQKKFSGHYFTVPYDFPFYTANSEGWGLYAEFLGEEMGVYKDDYEMMGRYGYEMFRACRLVVDTGLHDKGWSREVAIQYITDRIPMARTQVGIEVNRYLTWPGQACAYKIGELKIKELRQKVTAALGSKFDIRDFHYLLLINGRMPLTVMETMVNDYIADKTGTGAGSSIHGLSGSSAAAYLLLASMLFALIQQ